jgi:long-chain acyl-CoA synthetase
VGKVLNSNTIKIADDGEVLVKGAGVFSEYLTPGEPAAIDDAGFLATGDLGHIDADGYLTLVGRKSEIFKTSTGRKIAPIGIEAKLKRLEGIDHVVVIGAGRKLIGALITLAPTAGVPPATLRDAAMRIARQVGLILDSEPEYTRPAGLVVSRRVFSIEAGELTSNLKLRRKIIETNYHAEIERLLTLLEADGARFCDEFNDDICIVNCEGER